MAMTWDEFFSLVKDKMSYKTRKWGSEEMVLSWSGTEDHYEVTWVTGGMTGGNCWGDSPDRPVDADPEPELTEIDELLETICPNLGFLAYKTMMNGLIERGPASGYQEYYGNYTNYTYKRVNYRRLYDALIQRNAI